MDSFTDTLTQELVRCLPPLDTAEVAGPLNKLGVFKREYIQGLDNEASPMVRELSAYAAREFEVASYSEIFRTVWFTHIDPKRQYGLPEELNRAFNLNVMPANSNASAASAHSISVTPQGLAVGNRARGIEGQFVVTDAVLRRFLTVDAAPETQNWFYHDVWEQELKQGEVLRDLWNHNGRLPADMFDGISLPAGYVPGPYMVALGALSQLSVVARDRAMEPAALQLMGDVAQEFAGMDRSASSSWVRASLPFRIKAFAVCLSGYARRYNCSAEEQQQIYNSIVSQPRTLFAYYRRFMLEAHGSIACRADLESLKAVSGAFESSLLQIPGLSDWEKMVLLDVTGSDVFKKAMPLSHWLPHLSRNGDEEIHMILSDWRTRVTALAPYLERSQAHDIYGVADVNRLRAAFLLNHPQLLLSLPVACFEDSRRVSLLQVPFERLHEASVQDVVAVSDFHGFLPAIETYPHCASTLSWRDFLDIVTLIHHAVREEQPQREHLLGATFLQSLMSSYSRLLDDARAYKDAWVQQRVDKLRRDVFKVLRQLKPGDESLVERLDLLVSLVQSDGDAYADFSQWRETFSSDCDSTPAVSMLSMWLHHGSGATAVLEERKESPANSDFASQSESQGSDSAEETDRETIQHRLIKRTDALLGVLRRATPR